MYKLHQLTCTPHTDWYPLYIASLLYYLKEIENYFSLYGKYFLNSSWTALLIKGL
jgi:hypothetical protein